MKKNLQGAFIFAKVKAVYNGIVSASAVLAAGILIFVMFSVCAEIVMRYFFDSPIIWVIEISEYSLLFITFLATAWTLRRDAHISVDIGTRHFEGKTRALLGMISSFFGIVVCCVLVRYGVRVTWEYFLSGSYRPTLLEIPTYLILWVIPWGGFLLLIAFSESGYKNLQKWRKTSG